MISVLATVKKAMAGGIAAGLAGAGSVAAIIPAGTPMPWWGYLVTFAVSSLIGFIGVYLAPPNAAK